MPRLNEAELAARYGFAMAVLNSSPELKSLFQKAVAQTWTPERFQAELRNTAWYRNNSETWRNAVIQKHTDPATYKANIKQIRTRLGMMAVELGARASGAILDQMSETAYLFGWDDNQIRANLAQYVSFTDGRMLGHAGQVERELRQWAADQGVNVSDKWLRDNAAAIVGGTRTLDDSKRYLTDYAISANPHLAERLRAGQTLAEIAEPYRQTMAQLLEINPESVTMKDPMIRKALAHKNDKGQVVMRTLYEFENDLRADKRWLKTKNAQDAAMNTVNRVLRDMGVIS